MIKTFGLKPKSWFRCDMAEYFIESCLGRGYEGEAYAVREGYSDGYRVLKLFRDISENDFIDYTYRLEILSEVSPTFLRFYHGGCWNNHYFMVLERANGKDLSHFKNLSLFDSLNIVKQLFHCIAEAHNLATCVGDLYDVNIVYDPSNKKVKIIDFDYEAKFDQEYINEDNWFACQLFYFLCMDKVPIQLKNIIPSDETHIKNTTAAQILKQLNKLM